MAAEIRVDTVKARSGINTLSFTAQGGFTFLPGVGIGTTAVNDSVTSTNTGKLSVGIASARELYVGLVTSNYGDGKSYIHVGTGVSVIGITTFHDRIHVKSGISTFDDNVKLTFGTQGDMSIFHDGSHSRIQDTGTGNLALNGSIITMYNVADNEAMFVATQDGAIDLYHNGTKMFETTADGADFGGTGCVGITKGTTAQRPGSAAAGDFRYNSDDGKFEGYTNEWGEIGGGGGVSQVSGIVSTTSTVGFAASFAVADFRSASVNFLINDATGASQTGKYLMIHDGTTVTVVEQIAVATGSMLGTVSGQIAHSNAELLVTMVSAGVATCSAKIDTMADTAA